MPNSPIPAAAMPPLPPHAAVQGAWGAPGAASTIESDKEQFSAVLARELPGDAPPDPGAETAVPGAAADDGEPQQPGFEITASQMPPAPGVPDFLPTSSGDVDPAQAPLAPGVAASLLRGLTPGVQRHIPGAAPPAVLPTGAAVPRNFTQAVLPQLAAPVSDTAADLAASGKFAPLIANQIAVTHSAAAPIAALAVPDAGPLSQVTHPAIGLAPAAPASASAVANPRVDSRVGAPAWDGEFAQKVVWMATQQRQVAELHLNPPHLGPVEVRLTIGADRGAEASAQFASPHLAVREAIEAALPRLREMMADSGIALGNVTVSADSFRRHGEAGREDHPLLIPTGELRETAAGLAASPMTAFIRSAHSGLVDTFA